MGGGHSVENTVNIINKSVTDVMTSSIQNFSSQTSAIQKLNIECQQFADMTGKRLLGDPVQKIPGCFEIFKGRPLQDIEQICSTFMTCGASNVNISGAINVDMSSDMKTSMETEISNNIKNNVKSIMTQEMGLLQFGSKEENELNIFSEVTTRIMIEFIQNDFSNVKNTQELTVGNVSLSVVSMDSMVKMIQNNIIENESYQKVVNGISNFIVANSSQTSVMTGPLTVLFYVAGIIIGGLIIFGLILVIIKQNRNRNK